MNRDDAVIRADPWAEYAILTVHAHRRAVEFRRVPFAVDVWVRAILASGKPDAGWQAAMYRDTVA